MSFFSATAGKLFLSFPSNHATAVTKQVQVAWVQFMINDALAAIFWPRFKDILRTVASQARRSSAVHGVLSCSVVSPMQLQY